MTFAVAEQTIQTQAFAGSDAPHLTTINFASEDSAAHIVTMTLGCEDGSSYVIEFNRNGAYSTSRKVEAASPPGEDTGGDTPPAAHGASHGRRR